MRQDVREQADSPLAVAVIMSWLVKSYWNS